MKGLPAEKLFENTNEQNQTPPFRLGPGTQFFLWQALLYMLPLLFFFYLINPYKINL